MKFTLKEVKSAICKSQKNMAEYYNWQHTPVPVFYSDNKMFLDLLNIHIICPSAKMWYCYLKPYITEKQVVLQLKTQW